MMGLRTLPFAVHLVAEYDNPARCLSCGNRLTRHEDEAGNAFYWETDHQPYCLVRRVPMDGRLLTFPL